MKASESESKVAEVLSGLGFTSRNTIFADSCCSDEVNHDDPGENITSLFQKRWGESGTLAGLSGFPFMGKTGWHAFSSRCPQDGNVVVLFAPHVGISKNGIVGEITRKNHQVPS